MCQNPTFLSFLANSRAFGDKVREVLVVNTITRDMHKKITGLKSVKRLHSSKLCFGSCQ